MKISEMAEPTLAARREFIDVLSAAGWRVDDFGSLFEADADIEPEAVAIYRGNLVLDLEFRAKDHRLAFDLYLPDGEVIRCVRLHPKIQRSVLDRIISAQALLDEENHLNFVASLIPWCKRVLLTDQFETLELFSGVDGSLRWAETKNDDRPGSVIWYSTQN